MSKHYILRIFLTGLSLLLISCMPIDFSDRTYQQGTLISKSKVNRLRLGMAKQDVILILGDSLLHDPVNPNHLDYAYTWRRGNHYMKRKYLSLTFKNDKLIKIDKQLDPRL